MISKRSFGYQGNSDKADKLRNVMSYRYFSRFWLALPRRVRRLFIRLSHGSFTVSAAAVVVNSEGKVLALRHLMRPEPWGLPGGFIDWAEQPAEAIRRELREEVGIELEGLRLLLVRTIGRHIEMLFAARSDEEARILSSEIDELGWYAPDELSDRLPNDQLGIAQKVLRGEI
jgi:8-oxo-dGTP diphosphatase